MDQTRSTYLVPCRQFSQNVDAHLMRSLRVFILLDFSVDSITNSFSVSDFKNYFLLICALSVPAQKLYAVYIKC